MSAAVHKLEGLLCHAVHGPSYLQLMRDAEEAANAAHANAVSNLIISFQHVMSRTIEVLNII